MDIVPSLWDPKGDLNAYLEVCEPTFISRGSSLLARDQLTLSDGRLAVSFMVETPKGA